MSKFKEEISGLTKVGKTFQGYKENGDLHYPSPEEEEEFKRTEANPTEEYTGGSSSYYDVYIPDVGVVRCLDIIEALDMRYNEANVFKAAWRIAAANQGKKKKGNTNLYDAEKICFFGERLVLKEEQE
jgi:hypothetical protein